MFDWTLGRWVLDCSGQAFRGSHARRASAHNGRTGVLGKFLAVFCICPDVGLLCLLSLSRWQRWQQFCPLLHAHCQCWMCPAADAAGTWQLSDGQASDADVSLLSGMSRRSERRIMLTRIPATSTHLARPTRPLHARLIWLPVCLTARLPAHALLGTSWHLATVYTLVTAYSRCHQAIWHVRTHQLRTCSAAVPL